MNQALIRLNELKNMSEDYLELGQITVPRLELLNKLIEIFDRVDLDVFVYPNYSEGVEIEFISDKFHCWLEISYGIGQTKDGISVTFSRYLTENKSILDLEYEITSLDQLPLYVEFFIDYCRLMSKE